METLVSLLHWNYSWIESGWYWPFSLFMFVMFILMCFLFRRWRRGPYSCWWPGCSDYRYKEKTDAEETLKKRYVKGEISKEEYVRMMKDIS